jgi:mono/diheme cytochrome c family protein
MKRSIIITVAVVCVLLITTVIINQLTAQDSPKGVVAGKPIPANVLKIAEKSCVKCHTEPGNGMALAHVNLSNWDKYSPEKQAAKAKAMCSMVTKDKMPPKSFRAKNPDGVPSSEEIKTICNWAESLQVAKK